MECDFGNTLTCLPQLWDWLENREGKNDKVSGEMWKAMETKAEKIKAGKAEEGRKKEMREERTEKKGKEKT